MLFGFPGETEDDQWQSIDLMKNLIKKGAEIRLHYFLPLPGTSVGNMSPSPLSKAISSKLGQFTLRENVVGAFPTQLRFTKERNLKN